MFQINNTGVSPKLYRKLKANNHVGLYLGNKACVFGLLQNNRRGGEMFKKE